MDKRAHEKQELAERATYLEAELGSVVLKRMLAEHGLNEGLSQLEAASIAGCLLHMTPVGHSPHSVDHGDDEKMRTRIMNTPVREGATERDWQLYNFKQRLRTLSAEKHLFRHKTIAG